VEPRGAARREPSDGQPRRRAPEVQRPARPRPHGGRGRAVVDLDEKQEKLLNVALNRIEGQWDYEKLQDLFEEFSAEDIFATGYSDGELKTLFGGEDEDPTDLYQDDPEPEEDDGGGDTEEDDGEFSIYLSFPTRQAAEEWLEGEGIERGFPRGGRNLVIHMEGDSYEDTRN
jgi:hypothetical protein